MIRTQLVGDPAFLSADMKVLAICKCYGKKIRLVAGIYREILMERLSLHHT